jgi:hypothetical protein
MRYGYERLRYRYRIPHQFTSVFPLRSAFLVGDVPVLCMSLPFPFYFKQTSTRVYTDTHVPRRKNFLKDVRPFLNVKLDLKSAV